MMKSGKYFIDILEEMRRRKFASEISRPLVIKSKEYLIKVKKIDDVMLITSEPFSMVVLAVWSK